MDGVADKNKVWLCKKNNGHVLGLVVNDKLVLFRHAVEVENVGAGVTLGSADSMNDIECDICKAKRTWHIGEAALERFIEKRLRSEARNDNRN